MQLKCFGCFGEYRSVWKIACAACVILAVFLTETLQKIYPFMCRWRFLFSSLLLARFTYFLWIVTFKNIKLMLHISPWFSTLDIIVFLFVHFFLCIELLCNSLWTTLILWTLCAYTKCGKRVRAWCVCDGMREWEIRGFHNLKLIYPLHFHFIHFIYQ